MKPETNREHLLSAVRHMNNAIGNLTECQGLCGMYSVSDDLKALEKERDNIESLIKTLDEDGWN